MAPKDEPPENVLRSSDCKGAQSPVQAAAEEPIAFADTPEHTISQAGPSSPGASSDDYSDNLFDGRSGDNDTASLSSSRKTPIHRRLTKGFKYSSRRCKIPFYRSAYGPQVPQEIRSLDRYPQGYGKIAAIEACDPNFLIYRKFAWLHNRLLLHCQDELAQLERQLEELDLYHFREQPRRLISRRRDDVFPDGKRKDLLKAIDAKLLQYHSLLLRMQKIHAIKAPTKRNQSSLWKLVNNTQSQVSLETEWIHLGPDLAALAHDQEYGTFNTCLIAVTSTISKRLTKTLFQSPSQSLISGSEDLVLLSPTRIDIVVRTILTPLLAALLLPVLILSKTQPTSPAQVQQRGTTQILTVFAFTLVFSAACSLATKAKRGEEFAATAGYCAVLVVFMGSTSNVVAAGAAG